jgi:hypothetical protein
MSGVEKAVKLYGACTVPNDRRKREGWEQKRVGKTDQYDAKCPFVPSRGVGIHQAFFYSTTSILHFLIN